MLRTPRPLSVSRRAWLLLELGFFAVLMHTLAGMGLMGSHPGKSGSDGNFVAEVCTVLGIGSVQAAQNSAAGDSSQPDTGNPRDCCTLCVASSPLLFASASPAVSPAPIFGARFHAHPATRPASFAWTAHPPRGPPAHA